MPAIEGAAVDPDWWLANLLGNIFAYALVIVPAGLLVNYLKKNPDQMSGPGFFMSMLRLCVVGQPEVTSEPTTKKDDAESAVPTEKKDDEPQDSFAVQAFKLIFCAVGLQGSYLTWGVLQEQIMTQAYGDQNEKFTESQFLVFVNRILAFCAAVVITQVWEQPKHVVPVHKYSFTSLSNIMSSWFQYEALKYVSFPTQVLAKASKVIPVMLMGKIVSGKTYPMWEYGCAVCLSAGVALFMFSKDSASSGAETETTMAGVILLVGYMAFDSFTSNYQSALFKTYKMSKFQMMFGVNLFSCFFTLWSLVQRGHLMPSIAFMFRHSDFMFHITILSITSATGQLFIFHTIATYGPLVFTIIMTTRQVISIFLSAMIFGHTFTSLGWCGVFIVCATLFMRIYWKQQESKAKSSGPR
eukprot:m.1084517 g.1084517  ORF g.1084517 m.1084517 type:complete len:412 (-) comp24273_c0_seq2:4951-6186(-)